MERENQEVPEWYETPIEQLDLSVHAFNGLKRMGITTVGEATEWVKSDTDAMVSVVNLRGKSLKVLVQELKKKGYLDQDFQLRDSD